RPLKDFHLPGFYFDSREHYPWVELVRMADRMNTLVYKRTHTGDPDIAGVFGIHDCMGRVRRWGFEAVIGVGGKSPDPGDEDIALKINWIGINPNKTEFGDRGPRV